MAVNVTETAAREIHAIIRQQDLDPEKIYLRVGVKGGGCSGFNYLLDLTETHRESDEMWTFSYEAPAAPAKSAGPAISVGGRSDDAGNGNGDNDGGGGVATGAGEPFELRVVCDPKSYLYLNGTSIDFKDEIMGRGFVFNNPNASSTCGCGSSFSA